MDLAIKWLTLLALAMWASLCMINVQLQTHEKELKAAYPPAAAPKNRTYYNKVRGNSRRLQKQPNHLISYIHYLTFVAGALVVTIYNKRKEIIEFTQDQFVRMKSKIKFKENAEKTIIHIKQIVVSLKVTAVRSNVDLVKKLSQIWDNRRLLFIRTRNFCRSPNAFEQRIEPLLKRIREVAQERNKLGLLLVAAVHENKTIKQQWQVDQRAKTRLLQEIQITRQQIKELRSKYVNFQQLYLVTHQETIFLKNCVKKLTKDKAESDENLLLLVSKIYQSNDNNLKRYCTGYLVENKEKLSSKEVESKVEKLLHKHHVVASTSVHNKQALNKVDSSFHNKCQAQRIDETDKIYDLEKFETGEPKPVMRGLPGEYVWTVKDKDGIIEKLYQYDHGLDYDNGDTIRRIREYSVYHDKDCMLDFANARSTTIIHDRSARGSSENLPRVNLPSKRNFLTDSPVFQKFLQNNQNLVMANLPAPSPPLLCG